MKDWRSIPASAQITIDGFENGRATPIPGNLWPLRQAFEAASV
jgi:hypothetical protein